MVRCPASSFEARRHGEVPGVVLRGSLRSHLRMTPGLEPRSHLRMTPGLEPRSHLRMTPGLEPRSHLRMTETIRRLPTAPRGEGKIETDAKIESDRCQIGLIGNSTMPKAYFVVRSVVEP